MSSLKHTYELLNSETIKNAISAKNLSKLAEIMIFDLLPSTNDYLLDIAKENTAASGLVCLAETQSAGHGRHRRAWFSGEGKNLACSMLWFLPRAQPALSLAVAVMVAQALKKYGVPTGISLKWPNDIFFEGRKLAGILLESLPANNGNIGMVIGVGLNLQLPAEYKENWIDLAEITGATPKRNLMAGLLIDELLTGLPLYAQSGFAAFIDTWRELDGMQGKEIIVRTATETISGVMQGVGEQGELLLQHKTQGLLPFQGGAISVRIKEKL